MRLPLYAIIAALALSGCTSMLHKSFQKIVVNTPGVENARCILQTETNKYIELTPREVMVERSRLPMTVTCDKAGYYSSSVNVDSKIRMAPSQMNIFHGFIPGTAYDVASESIYDYPETIVVTLVPKPEPYSVPEEVHVLQKKVEEIRPAPPPSAPAEVEADKSLSKSLRK